MDQKTYQAIVNRQQRLPAQLEAARRKVFMLENEAKRLGMKELLTNPAHVNRSWDEMIDQGRANYGYDDLLGSRP